MSSCLSGSSSEAYGLDLDIVKSPFTSIRTLHTSSASSTPLESTVALLSSAYPNIFHTKNLTKTRKFIKQRDSFLDEAPELLLPFRGIDNSAFLLHQPIQEKPSFQIQTKIANFCENSCQSPGEVDFHESSLEFCDGYKEDFDAKSIFDEDMKEGIDSILGNLSVDTGIVDEFSDASCSSVRENTRCENPIPMGPGFGRKYDFGFGMKIDGAVRALRHVDDGNCSGSPIVDVHQNSPKFHKTPVLTNKKKKKVEKSTVESKDKESSKDNSPPKPNSWLILKLNFKEVLNAWSDRGSLFLDEIPGDDARLAHIDLFLEDGVREANVLCYKEKRHTRLFSKKIIYQVKKVNADRRSRMKGRFVRRLNSNTNCQS
ncbi:hypothetical protein I3760_08G033100 [Carya illinoinensis]|nr:hypothetical protein I3760_08G033100 [Carya illinoinensis]